MDRSPCGARLFLADPGADGQQVSDQQPRLGDVIAANVRAERARSRLTQDQLAKRLGWSKSTLWELESGRRKVTADDLPRLCEALGITLAQLMDRAAAEDLRRMGMD